MIEFNKKLEDGVSVVIPFYNRSKFLNRLLDSIETQTLSPEKIFIVDNGSTLKEANIAWNIIQSHNLLTKCCFLSSLDRGNANYARNLGYYLAETKYVAFLDSDDWWGEQHLSQSIECLKNSKKVAVYSGASIHDKKDVETRFSADVNELKNPFLLLFSKENYIAQTSSYIVNKQKLKDEVLWDENLKRHQDYDYFVSIFYETEGWCYFPETNVNVDWGEGGTQKKDIDFKSLVYFCEKWVSKIPDDVLKPYLLTMLKLSYDHKTPSEVKKFYRKMMSDNNYFFDKYYKLQAKTVSILMYNNTVKVLEVLKLKNTIQRTIKFFR